MHDVAITHWAQLCDWLEAHGLRPDRRALPDRFKTGVGNVNYKIALADGYAVLRHAPDGRLPDGGNDMGREYDVLQALSPHFSLSPRALAYCAAPSPIGRPFLLSEFKLGKVLQGRTECSQDGLPDRLTAMLVKLLATLHAVPAHAFVNAGVGRATGFAKRTLSGWSRRAHAVMPDRSVEPVSALVSVLAACVPHGEHLGIIHGDFKLDNVVVDPDDWSRPVGMLDWDMATLGDPLFDLATLLSYWVLPSDGSDLAGLGQMPTLNGNWPDRLSVADTYARSTGRSLEDLPFYMGLARLKLATIIMQIASRPSQSEQIAAHYEKVARALIRQGLDP